MQRIRLGDLLVKAGALDELQLKSALNEQQKWGGQLGKVLVDLGYVDEPTIVRALSKQLGLRRARLEGVDFPPEVLRRIDPNDARARQYVPEQLDRDRKTLVVAMVDPTDVEVVDDLTFRTGFRVEVSLAGETEVSRAIERMFFGRDEIRVDIGPISDDPGGVAHGPYYEIDPAQISSDVETAPRPGTGSGMAERFGPLPRSGAERFGPLPRPGGATTPPGVAAREGAAARENGWNDRSTTGAGRFGPLSGPATAPETWGEPSTVSQLSEPAAIEKVQAAQKRQNRAIRAMVDLLIERGVFTEDEFRARLSRSRS